jgi:ribose transport system substrate-binding protein
VSWILRVSVVVSLAAVLACIPACGKKDAGNTNTSNKIQIGIVTNCVADFWKICEAGAQKAVQDCKEQHNQDIELQFREPEQNFSTAHQTPIFESWEKQHFNGIAVSVISPEGQTEVLSRVAKKVPLVTVDNDAEQSGRLCYIGINNYEAGKAVGRLVKKAFPKGATVAVFIGDMKSANGKGRAGGVLDELAGEKDAKGGEEIKHPNNPDLKGRYFGKYFLVDGIVQEDGGQDKAAGKAGPVLARVKGMPDLCMIGLYAYNPRAILGEAKQKSMANQIKIIGFDEDWITLQGIAAGEIEGTVVQDPFMYGYKSVEVLAAKARGDDSKLVKEPIPYRVVTKDGGPDETVNGLVVKNLKVADFEKKLRDDLASVKK